MIHISSLIGIIASFLVFIYTMIRNEMSVTAKICSLIALFFFYDAQFTVTVHGLAGMRNFFELIGGTLLLVIAINQSYKNLKQNDATELAKKSPTQNGRVLLTLLICCLFVTSVSAIYLHDIPIDDVTKRESSVAITSQYIQFGPLNFSSDEEFRNWATHYMFPGDGTYNNPYFIQGLNITSSFGPCLRIRNVSGIWFYFEDCIFSSYPWYLAVELVNVSTAGFFMCYVYGSMELNDSSFCDIMDTMFYGHVYIADCINMGFLNNWFGEDSPVYVISIESQSMNVSFYECTFLATLEIYDSSNCYIIDNSFYWSVADNGFANEWDFNRYSEYGGSGVYVIPGSAASIDSNPSTLTDNPPIPGPFPWFTISTDTTTTTFYPPFLGNLDFILMGAIAFEIALIALILITRRESSHQ